MTSATTNQDSPKPLISFCIPTYNRWNYLLETLESIHVATSHLPSEVGYEIIVSDNASSDGTKECPNRFPVSRGLRCLRRTGTTHQANNLFFACAHATGEFIWLLGDDDPMFESAPRRLAELLAANSVDYIFVPRVLVNKDLSPHACGLQPGRAESGPRYFTSGKALFADRELGFSHLVGFYGCNVIRRGVWEESVAVLDRTSANLRLDPWGHLRVILHAIRDRPCCVMDSPGVRCRLNPSPTHHDSRVWLDDGVRVLQQAKEWGYPSNVIREEIHFCFHANTSMFAYNKSTGTRKGNLLKLADELHCREIVNERDFWVVLSRMSPSAIWLFFRFRNLFIRFRSLSLRMVKHLN